MRPGTRSEHCFNYLVANLLSKNLTEPNREACGDNSPTSKPFDFKASSVDAAKFTTNLDAT